MRHQSLFRYKSGEEESIDYYLMLLKIGSNKLLQKLMLTKLDATILDREILENETIVKLNVFAHILASQGLVDSSRDIINRTKKYSFKADSSKEGLLYYQSMFFVHFYNLDLEESLSDLEKFKDYTKDNQEKIFFYHSARLIVFFIQNNVQAAEEEYATLVDLGGMLARPYYQTHLKIFTFIIKILREEKDEESYIFIELIYPKLIAEAERLLILYFQLRYLIRFHTPEKVLEHIEKICDDSELDASNCSFIGHLLQSEFKKVFYLQIPIGHIRMRLEILRMHNEGNRIVELTPNGLNIADYFAIPFHPDQLDLRAGIVVREGKVEILTELQRCFLYHLISAGNAGIKWIKLAEAVHGKSLRFDLHFESIRKMAAKLRSIGLHIIYRDERYLLVPDFTSIIFALHFIPGNRILYIARHFKDKSFTAEDVSAVLGFKKSRTGEYILEWLEHKQIIQLSVKGKQKHYLINYDRVNPLDLASFDAV